MSLHEHASHRPSCTSDVASTDLSLARKRSREADDSTIPKPFAINAYSAISTHKPTVATPHFFIDRSSLPLSFLDLSSPEKPFGGFVRAKIGAFAQDGTCGGLSKSHVLIITLQQSPRLYALEYCGPDTFALCRLRSSIRLENLQRAAVGHNRALKAAKSDSKSAQHGDPWWAASAVQRDHTKTPLSKREKILIRTVDLTANDTDIDPANVNHEQPTSTESQPQDAPDQIGSSVEHAQPTIPSIDSLDPVQTYSEVVSTYLNTLYLSKASLAYFAKGPLSRARHAFDAVPHGDESAKPLPEYLRNLLLSATIFEKKYKEKLPGVILSIRTDGTTDVAESRRQKKPLRISNLPKPSKSGLYRDEEDYISRWWASESESDFQRDPAARLKTSVSALRFRESLMQLMLMLEILALEQHASDVQKQEESKPQEMRKTDATDSNELVPTTKKPEKSKKPQDLKLIMDVLVDRLSIWQSVTIGASSGDAETKRSSGTALESSAESSSSNDDLKDFCTAVAIPFYASRIPSVVKSLCRRLGTSYGKMTESVTNHKHGKAESNLVRTSKSKRSPDQRRSKASSGDKAVEARPPTLTRSATDSLTQGLGRQRSSTPLNNDVLRGTRKPLSRTSSMQNQMRPSSSREVDMTAIAKFNEARSRAKSNVEQELREAIATLKKPNRSLAVKELADASDGRRPTTKTRAPLRKSMSMIHIDATPRRASKHQQDTRRESLPEQHEQPTRFEDMIPSTNPAIPSSVVKAPSSRDLFADFRETSRSASKGPTNATVLDTPSKQRFGGFAVEQTPIKKPLTQPKQGLLSFLTPVKKTTSDSQDSTPVFASSGAREPTAYVQNAEIQKRVEPQLLQSMTSITSTPQRSTVQVRGETATASASEEQQRNEMSIYDALGWDEDEDDVDDLL